MRRDISANQMRTAAASHGITSYCLGYWRLPRGTLVYAANGGPTRRQQLAYLRRIADAEETEQPDPLDEALDACDGDIDLVD